MRVPSPSTRFARSGQALRDSWGIIPPIRALASLCENSSFAPP